jgi:hypothetical protein
MRRWTEAQTFLRRALKTFSDTGDKTQFCATLVHLSELYDGMGHTDDARDSALQALDLAVELGSEVLVEQTRENLKKVTLKEIGSLHHEPVKVTPASNRLRKVVRLEDYRAPHTKL